MTTKIISLDFELCSTLDLSDVGAYEWTKSKNTIPILCGFAANHGDPEVIEFGALTNWRSSLPAPGGANASRLERQLLHYISDPEAEIHAWNANFEFNVWNNICVPRFKWPALPIERFHCTMCAAACAGLPMSLDQAALAVGSPFLKDKSGHLNMMRMARPRSRNPLRWWHEEDPAKLQQLINYCLDDVRAEREVHKRVPKMTPREREIWLVDQAMNARGLPVDGKLLTAMHEITLQELLRLSAEINVRTGGFVTASSQNARLLNWCQNRGYPHVTLERETLSAFIGSTEFYHLPTDAQDVLKLRAEAGKTSTAKLLALQNYASTDGYARNLIQYGAAVRTLRWGGRGPQIQNFPRPVIQASNIAPAIDVILDDLDAATDTLRTLYGNPLDVISSCLRGVFKTPKGWSFVVCDYSAIEARVVAWLAEFEPLLAVFRDATQDVYIVTAAGVGSTNRQLGKVLRLACAYSMGHVKFQETANKAPYFLNLTIGDAHGAVTAFRTSNAPIVQLWHGVEATARNAILRPSDTLRFKKLGFRMANPSGRLAGALLMELPSGRNLVYRNARLENGRIVFWGVDQMTRRWKQLDTYGGKLVENATQAVARDLLADAIVVLEQARPGVALTTVHDEVIAMTEDHNAVNLLADLKGIMSAPPVWGRGLPLSSSGSISKRYGK